MKVFSGSANRPLAKQIVEYLDIPLGKTELTRFSDGELSVTYHESLRGKDIYLIQPTCPPSENMIEFLLMLDAAKRASADRITAVIPYFGYARQDRKDRPRVSLSAKLMANLISTAGADRILTMDLHSPSIQGFFDIPFDHLYSYTIFVEYLMSNHFENPVIVAPDVGSTKRARAYANRLNTDFAIVDKRRLGPNKIDSVTLIGNVQGRDVILIDDIIDTAGTLCSAAELLKKHKANRVLAACTHPLLSDDAVEKISQSSLSKVLVLDTVPIPEDKKCDKIEVLSSASLFGEAIRRIHKAESISSLFDSSF